MATPPPPPPSPPQAKEAQSAESAREDSSKTVQILVDTLEKQAGRARQGAVPIDVPFPDFGPSIFLAAELTAERQPPSLEIQYKRGGDR